MEAYIVEEPGGDFRKTDLPRPTLRPNHVLVRIKASGVNPLDTKIRAGKASHAKQSLPAVLGIDMAGTVEEIGPFVEKWLEDEKRGSEQRPDEPLIGEVTFGGMRTPLPRFGGIPPAKDATGEIDSMDFLVGQCVGLLNEIKSAAEIVREIVQRAGHILAEQGQQ